MVFPLVKVSIGLVFAGLLHNASVSVAAFGNLMSHNKCRVPPDNFGRNTYNREKLGTGVCLILLSLVACLSSVYKNAPPYNVYGGFESQSV